VAIENAIASMRERGLAGLAFRINAAIDASSNWIERCAFADYASAQFDHWVTSHQRQLWVINGPEDFSGAIYCWRPCAECSPISRPAIS
jgi:hypothetical protein